MPPIVVCAFVGVIEVLCAVIALLRLAAIYVYLLGEAL